MRDRAAGICLGQPGAFAAAAELRQQECLFALPPLLVALLVRQLPMLVWWLLVYETLTRVLLSCWLSAPAAAPLYNIPSTCPVR